MEEEIELLDVDDDLIITKKNQEKKNVEIKEEKKIGVKKEINNNDNSKRTKKKLKKSVARKMQILFCSFSAIFILGCCVFYGLRFIKYYRIYNPKIDGNTRGVFLADYIEGKTEYATDDEDGLVSSSGNYIYKGNVTNNYLKYNNMLWRIIRINSDKSIDIVLDDYISLLPWSKEIKSFKDSDIFKYLNKEFLNNLDKSLLTTTSYCTNEITELTKITCEKQDNDNYVKLLDIMNFLNSVNNGKSYLVKEEELVWLSDFGNEKVWHTNGINVSESDSNTFYEIRPVVRLKETSLYTEGDGTIANPYQLGSVDKLSVGSEVVLDNDKWIVYDMENSIKLMRKDLIEKQIDFDKEKLTYDGSNLMTYLNETYLNSLSYKDLLVENTWYIGAYKDSLNDVKETTVKAKVGIPNILDIKFDSDIKSYFTSTSMEDRILVYENPYRPSRITTYRSVRPCISLSKDTANKLKYVDGLFVLGE